MTGTTIQGGGGGKVPARTPGSCRVRHTTMAASTLAAARLTQTPIQTSPAAGSRAAMPAGRSAVSTRVPRESECKITISDQEDAQVWGCPGLIGADVDGRVGVLPQVAFHVGDDVDLVLVGAGAEAGRDVVISRRPAARFGSTPRAPLAYALGRVGAAGGVRGGCPGCVDERPGRRSSPRRASTSGASASPGVARGEAHVQQRGLGPRPWRP